MPERSARHSGNRRGMRARDEVELGYYTPVWVRWMTLIVCAISTLYLGYEGIDIAKGLGVSPVLGGAAGSLLTGVFCVLIVRMAAGKKHRILPHVFSINPRRRMEGRIVDLIHDGQVIRAEGNRIRRRMLLVQPLSSEWQHYSERQDRFDAKLAEINREVQELEGELARRYNDWRAFVGKPNHE